MTTQAAATRYLDDHQQKVRGKGYAVFNPQNRDIETLPFIYGFNNGGSPGWLNAVLLAEDGECLGGHLCSAEAYMPHDLGVLEGTRSDRHETFRAHYPNGYRMDFIGHSDVVTHPGLDAAVKLANARPV